MNCEVIFVEVFENTLGNLVVKQENYIEISASPMTRLFSITTPRQYEDRTLAILSSEEYFPGSTAFTIRNMSHLQENCFEVSYKDSPAISDVMVDCVFETVMTFFPFNMIPDRAGAKKTVHTMITRVE